MALQPYSLAAPGALQAENGAYVFGPDVTIVDDFEGYADTADFRAKWNTNDSPMDWGIGTSAIGDFPYSGSQYLQATDPGSGNDNAWTLPSDGVLNYYPQEGDHIVLYLTPQGPEGGGGSTKNRTYFRFDVIPDAGSGTKNEGNYAATVDVESDRFEIGYTDAGTYTEPDYISNVGWTMGTTYRAEIEWRVGGSSDIVLSLYNVGSESPIGSASMDPSFTPGGRGILFQGDWEGGTTACCHYDYIYVVN